jgi:tetratricopeptide (TPR) repeat protein
MVSGASPNSRDGVAVPDPEQVETLSELTVGLNALRGTSSYADLLKQSNEQQGLRRSTMSDLLNGKAMPKRETVVAFLSACGLNGQAQAPWLAAWERVVTAKLRRPDSAVRVRDARPLLLGVHRSIQVRTREAGDLPPYVSRDFDLDLCSAVTTAGEQGGFVLLVGDSSVGKTRALFEAVRARLPEWWLIHPDPADVDSLAALAPEQVRRTVVWLNELAEYLDSPARLTAATSRRLISAGLVLVGTLWSDEYTSRTAARVPARPDPHADARQLLDLAHVVLVPKAFTQAERCRAEAFRSDDRIRVALDSPDAGFTQVLAAAPLLERWWTTAPDPCAKALITAALDMRRIGAKAPLARELLAAAVPGYLTSTEQATAAQDWFDEALDYATTQLHGATSALRPTGTMGTISGYLVADYLLQQASRERHTVPVPDVVWQSIVLHHHPDDTQRLAESARAWGVQRHAESLYRQAADGGDIHAGIRLGELLTGEGRIAELRARADAGDRGAGLELVRLLAREGDLAELRIRSDAGDPVASRNLVALLIERGRLAEALTVLHTWAAAGDTAAWRHVQKLLAEQSELAELRVLADTGDGNVADRLVGLLAKYGHLEELRARADAGDEDAAWRLAELHTRQGNRGDALTIFRRRADTGDQKAACRVAELLAERGDIDEAIAILHAQPNAGGALTNTSTVADVLVERGRVGDLRALADAGNQPAAWRLADLLVTQGGVEELRVRADAGDDAAGTRLAGLLAKRGDFEELRTRAQAGDRAAARHLTDVPVRHGQVEGFGKADQIESFLPRQRPDLNSANGPLPLSHLGVMLRSARLFTEAIEACRHAVAVCRDADDRHGEGDALNVLGTCLAEVRRFDEAVAAFEEALALYGDEPDRKDRAAALRNLSQTLVHVRRFDEAALAARQAAEIFNQIGNQSGEAGALSALGRALAAMSRFGEAIPMQRKAVEIYRSVGDRLEEAVALQKLSSTLGETRRYTEAVELDRQALALSEDLGDEHLKGTALSSLGLNLIYVERFEDAVTVCAQAAEIFQRTADEMREGEALTNLGYSLQALGRYEELADVLDRLGRAEDAASLRDEIKDRTR